MVVIKPKNADRLSISEKDAVLEKLADILLEQSNPRSWIRLYCTLTW